MLYYNVGYNILKSFCNDPFNSMIKLDMEIIKYIRYLGRVYCIIYYVGK